MGPLTGQALVDTLDPNLLFKRAFREDSASVYLVEEGTALFVLKAAHHPYRRRALETEAKVLAATSSVPCLPPLEEHYSTGTHTALLRGYIVGDHPYYLSDSQKACVKDTLCQLHVLGIAMVDLQSCNLIISNQVPYLIDFDRAVFRDEISAAEFEAAKAFDLEATLLAYSRPLRRDPSEGSNAACL